MSLSSLTGWRGNRGGNRNGALVGNRVIIRVASILLTAPWISHTQAAPFELPPLNTPPSTEHHVGKVVWTDLVTPDLAVAERFYGELLGWTFQPVHAGASEYAVASASGSPLG